ncbi:MAG: hypothetical protein GYA55_14155 [SAR324 cluster bacterium]|uniref:Uncharacterized protein n=1 Tax=SAR324 cluster bacterium TaxID=2024889 RepID=A0A7X9IKN7_9DELT|nr:hypothetical protein [SAR324 cluster bacterium]
MRHPLLQLSVLVLFFLLTQILISAEAAMAVQKLVCVSDNGATYPAEAEAGQVKRIKTPTYRKRLNASLGKLNQTIKDLQVQIRRLNLKKTKAANSRVKKLRKQLKSSQTRKSELLEQKTILKYCFGGRIAETAPLLILKENFEIGSSEVFKHNSDLILQASTGSIHVAGTVETTKAGARLSLIASKGNITLAKGSLLRGASGGDGVLTRSLSHTLIRSPNTGKIVRVKAQIVSGGAGENGAGVRLEAAAGAVNFEPGFAIELGNGGNGADFSVSNIAALTGKQFELENAGGNSGILEIRASQLNGLEGAQLGTLQDGTQMWFPADNTGISGGRGGNAGSVSFPESESSASARNKHRGLILPVGSWIQNSSSSLGSVLGASKTAENPFYVEVTGSKGGDGWISGGNGQSLRCIGTTVRDAERRIWVGQSVAIQAGAGGPCFVPFGSPGKGGSAYAKGGDGDSATVPGQDGGMGGSATAFSGLGGFINQLIFGPPFKYGDCGDATAIGGNGGAGGGLCPSRVSTKGGDGGFGGQSIAQQCRIFPMSTVTSYGRLISISGNGGNGGDAKRGGSVGRGGSSPNPLLGEGRMPGSYKQQGTNGLGGITCGSVVPTPSPQYTSVPVEPTVDPTQTPPVVTPTPTPTQGYGSSCTCAKANLVVLNPAACVTEGISDASNPEHCVIFLGSGSVAHGTTYDFGGTTCVVEVRCPL